MFLDKRIFTVHDVIENKKYIFVGKYDETDSAIDKIIEKNITQSDTELLKKYYVDVFFKDVRDNHILIKCFINLDDNIYIIKKKISQYVFKDRNVEPYSLHLWCNKIKLTQNDKDLVLKRLEDNSDKIKFVNNEIKSYSVILGVEFKNENNGLKLLDNDLNNLKNRQFRMLMIQCIIPFTTH